MKSVVADPGRYDWEGDAPLRRPFAEAVIYELHVRGFTRHPNSGVACGKRGTFAGLVEKVPGLADLGVTVVELLPVFQFEVIHRGCRRRRGAGGDCLLRGDCRTRQRPFRPDPVLVRSLVDDRQREIDNLAGARKEGVTSLA